MVWVKITSVNEVSSCMWRNLLVLGWTPSLCDLIVAEYSECCSMPCFQSTQIFLCQPPSSWPPLAYCCSPLLIQDDDTGLEGHQRNCTHLPPNTGQTTRPSTSTTSAGWLVPPSLRANKVCSAQSPLFYVMVPQWWNKPLTKVRTAELLIFHKRLKTHLFRLHLNTHSMTPLISLMNSMYYAQMRASKLILFFHCYSINGDMLWLLSHDRCTYCKSLWTKASAKCPKC